MPTYRFTGDQERVFSTIPDPDGNGTWVAQPGDTIDLDIDPVTVEDDEGKKTTRSPIDGLELVKTPAKTAKTTAETKE